MGTVIDFHTHILPGIDDGSSSVQQSLEMLQAEKAQGIDRVILTPHFYANHDSPDRFLARRKRAAQELMAALEERKDLPEVAVGAEVKYFEGISDCEFLKDMAIVGSRCVLVEMPMSHWSERMLEEVVGIRHKQGLIPVIAHLDRYIAPFRTHGLPQKLAQLPLLVQANAEFFIRRSTRSMALRMLAADQIHLLGSDCHNLQSRAPNLGEALGIIRKKSGDDAIERIAEHQRYISAESRVK